MLTIQVDGQLEERLKHVAASSGTEPQAVATQLLDKNLPRPNDATLKLLAEWEAEDATTDIAELDRRREDGETLMKNLARNRIESEGPLARKLWESVAH
jgi:hypothetical protein